MSEEELDDADLAIALDILDIRLECLRLASEESMDPEGIATLCKYYFDHVMSGVVVPYPVDISGKPKKLKAAT